MEIQTTDEEAIEQCRKDIDKALELMDVAISVINRAVNEMERIRLGVKPE